CVRRMVVPSAGAKTFNDYLGFERGLWQRKTDHFLAVAKRRVLGIFLDAQCQRSETHELDFMAS
ncbi:hypothetical protein, partial [Pseudorhodobacter sp.]|uniref:hypothetical protein n=1 Tax=Pseudorhodobacter sp. TaxID=1934400 RepID=UPI00264A17F3